MPGPKSSKVKAATTKAQGKPCSALSALSALSKAKAKAKAKAKPGPEPMPAPPLRLSLWVVLDGDAEWDGFSNNTTTEGLLEWWATHNGFRTDRPDVMELLTWPNGNIDEGTAHVMSRDAILSEELPPGSRVHVRIAWMSP